MPESEGSSQGKPDTSIAEDRTADDMVGATVRASTEIIEAMTAIRTYVSGCLLNLQATSPDLPRQRDGLGMAIAQIDRCTEAAHLIRDLARRAARGETSKPTLPVT